MMEANEAMKAMARRLEETPAHVLRGDGTLDLAAAKLTEAADELTALRERVVTLEDALRTIEDDTRYVDNAYAKSAHNVARAALSAAIGEDIGGGRG